jgi:FkbM family methyltransferase
MLLPVRDHAARTILIFGQLQHERLETRLLRLLLADTRTVIDAGANLGWYSMLASKAMREGSVHAFEANPEILPYLAATAANRAAIKVHGCALAETNGHIDFFCAPSSNLSSAARMVGKKVSVPAMTLDHFARAELITEPVFVKLDIEGGELSMLRGARRFRTSFPDTIWMIEADEGLLKEAGESLTALDSELGLPRPGMHLLALGVDNRWQKISGFTDMALRYHKNAFMVPERALPRFQAAVQGAIE